MVFDSYVLQMLIGIQLMLVLEFGVGFLFFFQHLGFNVKIVKCH